MSRCPSCDSILTTAEMCRTLTLEDGTEVYEEFCNDCLNLYVYQVDDLSTSSYVFEHETEHLFTNFTSYSE